MTHLGSPDQQYAQRIKQIASDFQKYGLGEPQIESTVTSILTGGGGSLVSNPDSVPVYRCGIKASADESFHCFSEVVMDKGFDLVAAHLAVVDVVEQRLRYHYKMTQEERDETSRQNLAMIREEATA